MRHRKEIEKELKGGINEADLMVELLLDIRDYVSIPHRDLSNRQREDLTKGINDEPEESQGSQEESKPPDTERGREAEKAGSSDRGDSV